MSERMDNISTLSTLLIETTNEHERSIAAGIELKKQNDRKRKRNNIQLDKLKQLLLKEVGLINSERIDAEENKTNPEEEINECFKILWDRIYSDISIKIGNEGVTISQSRRKINNYRAKLKVHTLKCACILKGIKMKRSIVFQISNPKRIFSKKIFERGKNIDTTTSMLVDNVSDDRNFDSFQSKAYNQILKDNQLVAFTEISDQVCNSRKKKFQSEFNHELIFENLNVKFGNPKNHVTKNIDEYRLFKDLNKVEKKAFSDCLKKTESGKIADIDVCSLRGINEILFVRSTIVKGCIIMPYLGRYLNDGQSKIEIEHLESLGLKSGHDLVFHCFSNKHEEECDVAIQPLCSGHLAHFAATCSPENQDWKNVNCIMMPVLMKGKSGPQVYQFLISIKEIPPNTPLVWWYKHAYFNNPRLNVKQWFNVQDLTQLLREHLNTNTS